jgi:formate dehydrogenase iron-sulfur subunit
VTAPYTSEFSLIDLVLAEQRDMTAVERFSNLYDRSPGFARDYRNLIPLSRPKPGEQYAFVVDLDRCSGCKACVSACHSLNGLEENEMWRSAGTVVGDHSPYLQTVTSSCHHCVDPACAAGCPVLAYEKDADTGIVRHLDDQCIGCQYCLLKCPYDVPKYSKSKGIVRKCDLCHNRLAVGEAPACAQACPHEAIRVEIVSQESVREAALVPDAKIIPGAFPSSYTLPTTRYESEKEIPELARHASGTVRLEHPHWPLIIMLILSQAALGLHSVTAILQFDGNAPLNLLAGAAALFLFAGLAASIFHLGRPLKAWRAFLGWRRSWMSREILAFSVYALFATLLIWHPTDPVLLVSSLISGFISIFCSAMIYVDTRRPGWSSRSVFPSFFGTTFLLGPTIAGAFCGWIAPVFAPGLAAAATVVRTTLFAIRTQRPIRQRTAVALFCLSTLFSLLAIFNIMGQGAYWGIIACGSTIGAQMLDRWLFFVATPAPRMPGALNA